MQIDWPLVIEVLKALLTPVIAAVASYIAWQQWKTNELKVKLDRYDRRLRIYEEVKRILSLIMRDANVEVDELLKFRTATAEADFLFGQDIPEYLDQIYQRGLKLWQRNREYCDLYTTPPEGYNHQEVVEDMHVQLTWLTEQFTPAKNRFKPYLDISG